MQRRWLLPSACACLMVPLATRGGSLRVDINGDNDRRDAITTSATARRTSSDLNSIVASPPAAAVPASERR